MHASLRVLWPVLCALTATAPAADEGDPKDPPPAPTNVLVLVADDLGVEVLACYGAQPEQPPTPVIDALALEGVLFTHCWSNPLCTPSRAALQTGRYALRTGMGELVGGTQDTDLGPFGLPLAEVTLPELLELGAPGVWQSACIGKWHLGSADTGGASAPNMAGYGHFAGALGNFQLGESYTEWERVVDGVAAPETGYATTVQVDDALAWIGQATEPWACVVNFNAPHVPLHEPPAELHTQDLSQAGSPLEDGRPYYNAMVEALDTEIGRLLAGLGEAEERTLVVFVADNGTPASAVAPPLDPQHVKGSFFEGGVRVPLIVRGPQVALTGSTCDALVDLTDLWATVAGIAEIDPLLVLAPEVAIDGVSLLLYLADPTLPSLKEHVFTELFRPNGPQGGLPVFTGTGPVCQEDMGYGGPGTMVLTACGASLVGDQTTDLLVTGAPPSAPAWFVGSIFGQPIPVAGGWLVPQPESLLVPFPSDPNGEMLLPGLGFPAGPMSFYVQAAALDPAVPFGFAISNAVKLSVHPRNVKAARDERFKLVRQYNGGQDALYDLESDPFEENELLAAGPLAVEADAAYQSLSAALDALLASF